MQSEDLAESQSALLEEVTGEDNKVITNYANTAVSNFGKPGKETVRQKLSTMALFLWQKAATSRILSKQEVLLNSTITASHCKNIILPEENNVIKD